MANYLPWCSSVLPHEGISYNTYCETQKPYSITPQGHRLSNPFKDGFPDCLETCKLVYIYMK